jgi:hypothetical protein
MDGFLAHNATPVCTRCGKPMRYNVPRLGPAGGYVHADTGLLLCVEVPVSELRMYLYDKLKRGKKKDKRKCG